MQSDAYATRQAVYALRVALPPNNPLDH